MKRIFIICVIFFFNKIYAQNFENELLQKILFFKTIIKTNNDTIEFISSSKDFTKKNLIFAQGSLPLPIVFYDEKDVNVSLPFKTATHKNDFNFIIIKRKGVPLIGKYNRDEKGFLNAKGQIPILYEKSNNLKYRVFQLKTVVNFVAKNNLKTKPKIYLVGHSEGYRVVAKAAEDNVLVDKIVCLSADPFNRTTEEIVRQRDLCLNSRKDSIYQSNINTLVENFKSIGNNIENYKSDYELYNWACYNNELTFESLKKFNNPMLIIYGTNDQGARNNDLLPFLLKNKKLKLIAYPDFDHNFFSKLYNNKDELIEEVYNWDKVFADIKLWLLLGQ